MGKSHNDNIVLVIALFCKAVIIVGCLVGTILSLVPPKVPPSPEAGWIFISILVCSIFIWVARDPTLKE